MPQPTPSGRPPRPATSDEHHDILELVHGAEGEYDDAPRRPGFATAIPTSQYPPSSVSSMISHSLEAHQHRCTSAPFLRVDRPHSRSSSRASSGSDFHEGLGGGSGRNDRLIDSTMSAPVRATPRKSIVGVLPANFSPASGNLSPGKSKDDLAARPLKHSRRCRITSLCAFVVVSVVFLFVIASVAVLAAFLTESFVSESDHVRARVSGVSFASTANLQLKFMQSLSTASSAVLTNFPKNVRGDPPPVPLSPNTPLVVLVNASAFAGFAAGSIESFCAANTLIDPILCPRVLGVSVTMFSNYAQMGVPSTAQSVYQLSIVSAMSDDVGTFSLIELVTDAYNETVFPSGVTASNSQVPTGILKPYSALLTANVSVLEPVTALPLAPWRYSIDPIGYNSSGGFRTDAVSPTQQLRSFTNDSFWLQRVLQGASTTTRSSTLLLDTDRNALRQTITHPLSFRDGALATAVFAISHSVVGILESITPAPYSRACLVSVPRAESLESREILKCRRSPETEEEDYEVMDINEQRLTDRLSELLDNAIAERAAAGNPSTFVATAPYVPQRMFLGRPVHVIAWVRVTSLRLADLDTDGASCPGELWILVITLKPSTVMPSENIPLLVSGVVYAVIVFAAVVYLFAFYRGFVRPLNDLYRRMGQVATLDFSSIPETTFDSASFEVRSDGGISDSNEHFEAMQKRNASLWPSSSLSDVQKLYDSFFHVAGALRSVVPFLPAMYRPPSPDTPSKSALESPSPKSALDPPLTSFSPLSSQNPLINFASHGAPEEIETEKGSTDEDDSDEPSRLSSISEIDLSNQRQHASESQLSDNSRSQESSTKTPRAQSAGDSVRRSPRSRAVATASSPQITVISPLVPPTQLQQQPQQPAPNQTPTSSAIAPASTVNMSLAAPLHAKGPSQARLNESFTPMPSHHAIPTVQTTMPEKIRQRYSNETHNASVIIAYFQLYMRRSARNSPSLAAEIQREFITCGISWSAFRRGEISNVTPHSIVVAWSSHSPELKACTAALEFCNHMKRFSQSRGELAHSFRVAVGIAHGQATMGVLGTTSKKFFVCDGPSVSRAAIFASAGVHIQAGVVVAQTVHDTVHIFANLRPIDVLSFPRNLRRERKDVAEVIYQCLNLDQQEEDEEWMYRLDKKNQDVATMASPVAGTLTVVPHDDSESACYWRGFRAWCRGELAIARYEFDEALTQARAHKKDVDDPLVAARLELLNEAMLAVPEFDERCGPLPSETGPNGITSLSSFANFSIASNPQETSFRGGSLIRRREPAKAAASAESIVAVLSPSIHKNLAPTASGRVRRMLEFFDGVRRGRPYVRGASQLGVETFAFEA
jgi:hypothetical protein